MQLQNSHEKNAPKEKMHASANGRLFEYARALRKKMTPAESILWEHIRNKKLGAKFRRQHPIEAYILDFYCHELKVGIEVDGSIHEYGDNKLYDTYRTLHLKEYDIKIIRFRNEEVLNNLDEVIARLKNLIPSPSPKGEGR
jgi:very-short-patch-repair endonuclease